MFEIEKSVGFLLAKAYQRGFGIFKGHLMPYNITPPQFSLLAFLWMEDGISQTELSERSQIDRTTMGGLVDRLAEEGLVKRRPHPDDRRAYRVCLTDKGKTLETELCKLAEVATTGLTERLTSEEVEALRGLLEKLRG